jgi:hypothetical protein
MSLTFLRSLDNAERFELFAFMSSNPYVTLANVEEFCASD